MEPIVTGVHIQNQFDPISMILDIRRFFQIMSKINVPLARVRYVTPAGIHTYTQYGELMEVVSSCNWMLVQKNHYDLSNVVQDFLHEKFQISQKRFKDYQIWLPK